MPDDDLKTRLMGGMSPFNDFCKAIGKHPKTVKKMKPPIVRIGRSEFVIEDQGRNWIQNGCPPVEPERRGRGRPRGGGAA
jgi:hypothetical protein